MESNKITDRELFRLTQVILNSMDSHGLLDSEDEGIEELVEEIITKAAYKIDLIKEKQPEIEGLSTGSTFEPEIHL